MQPTARMLDHRDMTQLFFDSGQAGPGTHALIIGVGGYPHLEGGTGTLIEDPLRYGNLGQLASPPRSALAFRNCLYESAHSAWKAPLATIEVLISPTPGDPEPSRPGSAFRDASIDGIQEAFDRWKDRCDSDPHNVAIFYFCGHGLEGEEQILLASDFGRFPNNHFRGAFTFDFTRKGFLQCLPETQCFFIDACREVAPGVVVGLSRVTAEPLIRPHAYGLRRCKYDLTLQSSAPFERAFAPVGEVSYFTTALTSALKGAAASTDDSGDLVIRTDGVSSCIDELLMTASGRDQATAKGPGFAPTVLYRLDKSPDVALGDRMRSGSQTRAGLAGHVFISYVREDSLQVDRLQQALEAAGAPVWRDTADLWPGEDWRAKIRHAITDDAFVFLACFSRKSLARKKTYQNEELTLAIEQLRLRRPGEPWLIPVRFDQCEIPDLGIGGGRTLTSIQRADLFGDHFENSVIRLIEAVKRILGHQAGTF